METQTSTRAKTPSAKNLSDEAFFDATFWRACGAIACTLISASSMNIAAFPLFDNVFSPVRDISVTANALLIIAIGLIAAFRPRLLHTNVLNRVLLTCIAFGIVGLIVAYAVASPALLTLFASIFALGRAWPGLLSGLAASRLSRRQVSACVVIAFVAQYVAEAFLWLAPSIIGSIIFLVSPVLSYALCAREALPLIRETERAEAPIEVSITQPASFIPLTGRLFASLFLFHIALGCSLRFGEAEGSPLPSFVVIVPVAAVAAYVLLSRRRLPADLTCQLSVLAVVAGFLCMNLDIDGSHAASVVLLSTGYALFEILAWVVLIAVAGRNPRAGISVLAWGRGISGFGSIVGAAVGVWGNAQVANNTTLLGLVSSILVLLFVGYVLIGLKGFSFASVIDDVVPAASGSTLVAPSVAATPYETSFEKRCLIVAERAGLTARETEVLTMLARGRDRSYIQEQLVVSRNTVKAHVKHIYSKLGIHSHQDLIDLVENAQQ